jgi:hypothetical protein
MKSPSLNNKRGGLFTDRQRSLSRVNPGKSRMPCCCVNQKIGAIDKINYEGVIIVPSNKKQLSMCRLKRWQDGKISKLQLRWLAPTRQP